MAIFEIQGPDGSTYEVDAPDENSAVKAFQSFSTTQTPQQSQAGVGSTAGGLAKAYGVGVGEGAIGMGGIIGDMQSMGGNINAWLADKLGASPEAKDALRNMGMVTFSPGIGPTSAKMPTSSGIKSAVEGVTGEFYKPQNTAEEYANTLGQFTPGALLGPGGAGPKIGGAVGGATGSETAAQATKNNPSAEPYARLVGGLLGGLSGGVAGNAATTKKTVPAAIQDIDMMQAKKNAAYNAVDASGVTYKNEAIQNMVKNVGTKWDKMKLNPDRHSDAYSFVNQLEEFAKTSPTLTELDQFRQIVKRDLIDGVDDANAAFGKVVIKEVDNLINEASPEMVSAGNPVEAAALIEKARKANTAYRSTEEVLNKMDRAERQALKSGKGTNQDNALRQKVDELINQKGGSFYEMQSKAVQDKMQEVVRGTAGRNAARSFGAFAPTGIVSTTGSGAAGAWLGSLFGPAGTAIGAVGLPAAGYVGKKIADKGTQKAVADLLRLIQANGDASAAGLRSGPGLVGRSVPQALLGGYSSSVPQRGGLLSRPTY